MTFTTVKINQKSGTQTIEIPGSFRIDDDKVYIKKSGNMIYIIPYHKPWESLVESVDEFSEDFFDKHENL